MNDKVNTVVIGKLIKEELQRQGKTSVWLANELGCHRTNIYIRYTIALPSIRACCSTSVKS